MSDEARPVNWAEPTAEGMLVTPFDTRLIGVEQRLPSRLVRLAALPWSGAWEAQLRAEKKSTHTLRSYGTAVRQFVRTTLPGECPLIERIPEVEGSDENHESENRPPATEELEGMTVEALHTRLDPNNGRLDLWLQSLSHLRPSTINARIAAATHLLRWLGYMVPEWVARPSRSRPLPKVLTRDEVVKVRRAAADSENPLAVPIIATLLDTGMRVSELCALDLGSIDLRDRSAMVIAGKGDKDRTVLFTDRTVDAVHAWLPVREMMIEGNDVPAADQEALFLSRVGRRVTPRGIQKMMDGIADAADIPRTRLSPHTLRHNFATGLLERGVDLVSIQKLLGHSNIQTTRVYLEINDQTLREIYHRAQAARADDED